MEELESEEKDEPIAEESKEDGVLEYVKSLPNTILTKAQKIMVLTSVVYGDLESKKDYLMYASNFAQEQLDTLMDLYDKHLKELPSQTKDGVINAYNDFNEQRYTKLAKQQEERDAIINSIKQMNYELYGVEDPTMQEGAH